MATIYVPGKGHMDTTLFNIDRALHQYDENLYLKFNDEQQEWCVYVKVPRDSDIPDVPVLGLGHEKPHKDYVMEKIHKMDTKTHAKNMLTEIDRHNDRIKAERALQFKDAVLDAGEKVVAGALHNKVNWKV